MKKTIYLSHIINNHIPLYGGVKNIHIHSSSSIQEGGTANSLSLSFPNHTGTHVDVPYHFFINGKTLTDYSASFWVFHYPQCIDVPGNDGYLVQYNDVREKIKDETDLLLLRTGYEIFRNESRYWKKNPGISQKLAQELRLNYQNIRAVGIDVISITSWMNRNEGRKAHQEFLGHHYKSNPIVLIEDMSLKGFTEGISEVIILPLMIGGADGAPCTIIAR